MNAKEQLQIIFGEGGVVALFGEIVDRGDGVYRYKEKPVLIMFATTKKCYLTI